MLRADDLGLIGGKLMQQVTLKTNDKLHAAINSMALATGTTVADFVRNAVIKEILAEKQRFDLMVAVFGDSKETVTSSDIQNGKTPAEQG